MQARSGRLEYVETIRGLACLLLVAFHVTGTNLTDGLMLDQWHPLRIVNDGLDNSRMPIFSFISGFVLSAAIVSVSQWQGAMLSKVKRLLVPMAVVSAIFYAMRALADYDQQPFLSIFFVQYAHYWFLQATFVLTALLLTVSLLLKGRSDLAAVVLLIFFVPFFIFVGRWEPNVMSMFQGSYLAPFFLSGHLFAYYLRHRTQRDEGDLPAWLTVVLGVLLALLLVVNTAVVLELLHLPRPIVNVHRVILGLCSALFLFLFKPRSKILFYFGTHTYAIFLFHVMFTGTTREVLQKLWPALPPELIFLPAFLMGLFGPILIEKLALKTDLTALLLLGIDLKAQRHKAARRKEETAQAVPGAWAPVIPTAPRETG
ncbi:acyltransferase [Devosia sp. ZW T5_3]|uniref:acyltransferase family protein n=1 Tax=Devosia sp. ZW T5_3 TaxID=3378085 RepID=UPI003852B83F